MSCGTLQNNETNDIGYDQLKQETFKNVNIFVIIKQMKWKNIN